MCDFYNRNIEPFNFWHIMMQGKSNPVIKLQTNFGDIEDQNMNDDELKEFQDEVEKRIRDIVHLKHYVSLLSQILFSDLPQLAVMCLLQPSDF